MKFNSLIFLLFALLIQLYVLNALSIERFDLPMKLCVEPEKSLVWVGYTFMVNVSAVDVGDPGLWGYEFKLYYDNTMLECLNVTLPKGHFLTPVNPERIWIIKCEINQSSGYAVVAVSLWGLESPRRGNGTLATIAFEAKCLGNSTLEFRDCNFVSNVSGWGDEIVHNGLVQVVPFEDLNLDGLINIKDIALVGKAFGSYTGDQRWNPIADVNKDGNINILDLALIARNFGKAW